MAPRSGGRATAGMPFLQGKGGLEESPGSTKARRRITSARSGALKAPGRGIAPQKANRPGTRPEVRVKGWGKSPPRPWRQGWQGKPRLEQDRIGTDAAIILAEIGWQARFRAPSGLVARGGPQGPSQRNGRPGAARLRTEPGLQAVRSRFTHLLWTALRRPVSPPSV
jgi:hypothetical protein